MQLSATGKCIRDRYNPNTLVTEENNRLEAGMEIALIIIVFDPSSPELLVVCL